MKKKAAQQKAMMGPSGSNRRPSRMPRGNSPLDLIMAGPIPQRGARKPNMRSEPYWA